MDDWRRADDADARRRAQAMAIANENRMLAEKKRQANLATTVNRDCREETYIKNYYYQVQSHTIR